MIKKIKRVYKSFCAKIQMIYAIVTNGTVIVVIEKEIGPVQENGDVDIKRAVMVHGLTPMETVSTLVACCNNIVENVSK